MNIFAIVVVFCLVVFGATLILQRYCDGLYEDSDKEQSSMDNSSDVLRGTCMGVSGSNMADDNRQEYSRCDMGVGGEMEKEVAVINGLQNLRKTLSDTEKEYLDYACDCVLTIRNLRNQIAEVRKGAVNEDNGV